MPAATLNMSVVLQGGSRPDTGWVIPVTVRLFIAGGNILSDAPLYIFNLITTKSGATATCNATGIQPRTYDITIVSEHTLMNVKRSVVISSPSTWVNMGTLLEGNANDDFLVNISDFGILAVSFMRTSGQPGFDARADFDQNGIIDISDFGLLAVNFMQTSPQTVNP